MLLRLCASFCLVFCALVSAQTKDLLSLAAGDSVYFGALFEEDNEVYGYVSIYDLEAVNKRERKYEYIILDTRLNEVANGEFIAPDYDYFTEGIQSVSKIGNKLLIGKRHWPRTFAIIIFYTYLEIDLDSNIVTGPFYYENDQFHEGFRDPKKVKKEQKKIDAFDKLLSFNNGYLY
ncbi:MAG: hypothetical protein K0U54_07745, partial [Bacteroidetes bacterium]|nr:hypothetical protein [Bacteroidota bacterium]